MNPQTTTRQVHTRLNRLLAACPLGLDAEFTAFLYWAYVADDSRRSALFDYLTCIVWETANVFRDDLNTLFDPRTPMPMGGEAAAHILRQHLFRGSNLEGFRDELAAWLRDDQQEPDLLAPLAGVAMLFLSTGTAISGRLKANQPGWVIQP